jgi:hypothetical protein
LKAPSLDSASYLKPNKSFQQTQFVFKIRWAGSTSVISMTC